MPAPVRRKTVVGWPPAWGGGDVGVAVAGPGVFVIVGVRVIVGVKVMVGVKVIVGVSVIVGVLVGVGAGVMFSMQRASLTKTSLP